MCGFLVDISKKPNFPSGILQHRGPDEQYVHEEATWRIEYFRLAITGLLEGKSPALSKGNSYAAYLNGEIYNFRDLQSTFHLPNSNSDSVTIANLVEMHGVQALRYIRGMYALILHDLRANLLYVARDPLGEKPLFMCKSEHRLILGSEFKAVLKIAGGSIHLNQKAVSDYLRFNFVEEPSTFDRRIVAFPKGELFEIDPEKRSATKIATLDGYSETELSMSLEDLLSNVLDQTISTEVPSALSLSSGLDSTSILVRKMLHSDSQFSAITLNTGYDLSVSEVVDVKRHAEAAGTKLDVVSTDGVSSPNIIRELVGAMDQPICDPSALNYYLIFEQARKLSKKVVLLGQGPDEFFWGYPHYYELLAKFSDSKLSLEHPIFLNVPQKSSRLLKFLAPTKTDFRRTLNSSDSFLNSKNKWELLRANMVHSYLSHNGFSQIDRLSMHFSIEARSPLADSRLYGWAQHNSLKDKTSFDKKEFKNSLFLGALEHVKHQPKKGFRSDITSIVADKTFNSLFDEAYSMVFKSKLIDWKLRYPKFVLTENEKWKVLVLGLWLISLES